MPELVPKPLDTVGTLNKSRWIYYSLAIVFAFVVALLKLPNDDDDDDDDDDDQDVDVDVEDDDDDDDDDDGGDDEDDDDDDDDEYFCIVEVPLGVHMGTLVHKQVDLHSFIARRYKYQMLLLRRSWKLL